MALAFSEGGGLVTARVERSSKIPRIVRPKASTVDVQEHELIVAVGEAEAGSSSILFNKSLEVNGLGAVVGSHDRSSENDASKLSPHKFTEPPATRRAAWTIKGVTCLPRTAFQSCCASLLMQ